jgi:exodeoxyribonuclease VII small subunit
MKTEKEEAAEDIASLPFEKAMAELERIVADLEKGSVSLDESVRLYARGKALQERCEKLLAEAEARVEKITLGENGAPKGVAPLDVE